MTAGTRHSPASPEPDEALAAKAQAGNSRAADELLRRYREPVRKRAAHYFGFSLEPEDIVQEGLLALLSAVYAYRADRGAGFSTFASACVENRLRSVVKENASPKNGPLNTYIPLDTLEIAGDGDPVQKIISEEETSEWFRAFETDLSLLESSVLKYFLQGYSYREIAVRLGITEKAADNALQRVRSKARKKRASY